MEVVYCDNHVLVVVKPSGISSQPHLHADDNLTDQAKVWIQKKYRKPGAVFLEPIHRLDKPVSGLVLFARTSKALSRLQEALRRREVTRVYYALVDSIPPALEGVLEHCLVHDEHRARVVASSHPDGKSARLRYRILNLETAVSKCNAPLLEIQLETGRYHQIRIQLATEGFPVRGDKKYGSCTAWSFGGIALHHGRLEFIHPVTRESMVLEAKHSAICTAFSAAPFKS